MSFHSLHLGKPVAVVDPSRQKIEENDDDTLISDDEIVPDSSGSSYRPSESDGK